MNLESINFEMDEYIKETPYLLNTYHGKTKFFINNVEQVVNLCYIIKTYVHR